MKIYDYENLPCEFFSRIEFENITSVNDIISDVRKNGDKAVKKYSRQFGDGYTETFKLSQDQIKGCIDAVDKETLDAINYAVNNVRKFAKEQLTCLKELETNISGNILGHKIVPLDSVGCYIPGGNYPLPSSAIMTIVPAKVAGVKRIVAVSPKITPVTAAAAHIAGADEIYTVGGVQAVAALAYGTETIKKVDKITGPGNKFVTAAKKHVYGQCGIDFLAGPSEVLIVADESAKPEFVAADILAQCEHDKDAKAFLICFSKKFAETVDKYACEFLDNLPAKSIAEISYGNSFAVIVNNIEEAVKLSNEKAPEHLELCIKNVEEKKGEFVNYGSLFIGNYSAEVFGDYVSGTNHTLPTNGVAKYTGGLSVFDYVKILTYQKVTETALTQTVSFASKLAEKEGLFAHKLAADIRTRN